MERDINSVIGFSIAASDGIIGRLDEFYFDDKTWKIRYLIIRTKKPLNSRKVLISTVAVPKQIWKKGLIPVDLTTEQINLSPDIDTDRPVSLQQETELYGHYSWRVDVADLPQKEENTGSTNTEPLINKTILTEIHSDKSSGEYLQLCSTARITNYVVYAKDGQVGKVSDFVFDEQSWDLLSIIVESSDAAGAKKVRIGTGHITDIDWTKFELFLDISTADIEVLPQFKTEPKLSPRISQD